MSAKIEEFETLLSLATDWVGDLERVVLEKGSPLDEAQTRDALAAGVVQPERVRILVVPQVPMPEHPVLLAACESTRAIGPGTWALCVRYGILIRNDRAQQREIVVHELVHTSQYERRGGIQSFLREYLQECLAVGYPHGAMEQEAIVTAARICGTK